MAIVSRRPGSRASPRDFGEGRAGSAVLLAVAAIGLPFVASGYHVFQLAQVAVYAIALLGLNLLTGYNGQISLGHGAFYRDRRAIPRRS